MIRESFFILVFSALFSSMAFAQVERFESSSEKTDLPGRFIYNPATGESVTNTAAKHSDKFTTISTGLKGGDSFTIEAFAKPSSELESQPRNQLVVFKSVGESGFFFGGIYKTPAPHSYNWWSSRIIGAGPQPVDLRKSSYRSYNMAFDETPWRHIAFSFDKETKTAKFFVDYRLQNKAIIENTAEWDLSTIEIGGSEFSKMLPWQGLIDEVRVSPNSVLPPSDFLRASDTPISDVDFAREKIPALPADYGHVDVRLHYGAIGDGVHDDTAAIQKAFAENQNRVPNGYATIYFPEGTYRLTDTIRFSRFLVVRGAGKGKTKFIIDDSAEGFGDPEDPKVVFAVGYDWPYLGRTKKNQAGNVIGNYLFDFTIETGNDNPGAVAFDFHCNNIGCAENIDLISKDGSGLVGLDLKRGWPGPCLMKNMVIDGFDVGIDASFREYSLVFSGITLKNQNQVAIRNRGNILSLENVTSVNKVPAIQSCGGGLITLINSKLSGGSPKETAITSENGSLYLRNIEIDGYARSVFETKTPKDAPEEIINEVTETSIAEHFTGPFQSQFPTNDKGSLKLEIKQTPHLPRPPISDWVNVTAFEEEVVNGDWAPAIQAAIDSGKSLVYFPDRVKYEIRSDVHIRGNVRQFFGGSPKTGISNGAENPADGSAFVIADKMKTFQIDLLVLPHIRHESETTLVVRHCHFDHISASKNCGDLFIEDAGKKFRFGEHQRVWARQLNPETKGIPEIINDGGQLWVLGLKTEYLSTKIQNQNGASTEILGGLMYPVHPVKDEALPMFINENSSISLIHGVSVYGKNHKIYMRDTQNGETKEHRDWDWSNGRPITNLYRSDK